MKVLPLSCLAVLLASASTVSGCAQEQSSGPASPPQSDVVAVPSPAEPTLSPPPAPGSQAQPGDLPPCPGINSDIRRPAGSNCLGAVPQDCGADKAQKFVGQEATADVRREIEGYAVSYARFYQTGDALIQNLDYGRLNVEMNAVDEIIAIDCF